MRRITALWESFYSKDFYSDVYRNWRGIGFTLLLVLAVIQTVVSTVKIHVGLGQFVREHAPSMVKQIPTITFKDGKASTPEAVRYDIKDPQTGQVIAVIDTRESQPPEDLGGGMIFLAANRMAVKKTETENQFHDYTSFGNSAIDQQGINDVLGVMQHIGAIICAPFIFGFLLVWRLLQLLFLSMVTVALCNITRLEGSYAAKLRLTAAAITPALLLAIVCIAFDVNFPYIGLVFCGLVIGYIVFGIRAVWTPPPVSEPQHG